MTTISRPAAVRGLPVMMIVAALLLAGAIVALGIGSVRIAPIEIIEHLIGGRSISGNSVIVWDVRLPRIALALLVGANIAVSGALLQTVMGNPLADPGLTGVTSGAAVLVLLILLAAPQHSALIPIAAFVGGGVAAAVVYLLAWRRDGIKPLSIILAGVAVNSLAGGAIGLLSLRFSDRLPAAVQWMNGSLAAKGIDTVLMLLPYTAVGLVAGLFCIRTANVMRLGDEVAGNLGERVNRSRVALSIVAVFLAAVSVAAVGLLGFVGLLVPHIARILVGSDHRRVLPLSMLLGAALVLASDTVGRSIFAPLEIPAGIVMAFIGAPYFLFLMRRQAL